MNMEPSEGKNNLQMLSHLLAIAYHVLEETKHMNLKPPLRPMSKLFAADVVVPGSPSSETETPQDEALGDVNGLTAAFGGGAPTHASGQGQCVVVPFLPEEIQDTYTRIATLKTQYMKLSMELLEALEETEKKNMEVGLHEKDNVMANMITRRNQLRKEVYERNIVMKGLIDRLRHLQHSIRLLKGGSAYPPNIVMESV
ncbi:unnamed protein product [Peronospora farinosa]|uniref:Uncharacterized protein n=1 Tax=Peronospora farinosa TaxID=134698 RepID=A0AAV0SU47_9STRA|nr:unnamed protein product [Peronospora farinosa]CAI5705349.1 unnamed protein product [Peronospora farinosa]